VDKKLKRDHVMPENNKTIDILKEILSTITETNSLQPLAAVVCDGTVNNTGKRSGVIRRLEKGVERRLQWFVCFTRKRTTFKKLHVCC